jgi:hypothetical protein
MSGDNIRRIVAEIEYLLAKRARTSGTRPRLVVSHGHHQAVQHCLPGETIERAWFSVRSGAIPLRLSGNGLVLLDVLARKKPQPLTAAHIERILATDPFYVHLGANGVPAERQRIRLSRKTIKIYIQRLRKQIGKALKKAGFAMRPEEVLISEDTELLNVTAYRLAIPCEFVHEVGTRVRRQTCRPFRWN